MKSFGEEFCLTLPTDDAALAAKADDSGVDRIGLDLEQLGKAKRQSGLDTRLSKHREEDIVVVARSLVRAKLFVRLNPINANSSAEVEMAIHSGAEVLMLPFFRTAGEVETFVRLVNGRAVVIILIETASEVVRIRQILSVPGVQEIMIGLNDLRLELGVQNHFEVLASPVLDLLASEVRNAKLAFSVGGVARPDDLSLPVAPDLVLAQYPRLGATGAWISRSFLRGVPPAWDLAAAIAAVRRRLTEWAAAPQAELERAREQLAARAREIAAGP